MGVAECETFARRGDEQMIIMLITMTFALVLLLFIMAILMGNRVDTNIAVTTQVKPPNLRRGLQ